MVITDWEEKPRYSITFTFHSRWNSHPTTDTRGRHVTKMVDFHRQLYTDIVFFFLLIGDKSTLCYTSKNHKWTLFPPPVAQTGSEGCQERPPPVCIWHETGICPKQKNTKRILSSLHSYWVVDLKYDLFFFFLFYYYLFTDKLNINTLQTN